MLTHIGCHGTESEERQVAELGGIVTFGENEDQRAVAYEIAFVRYSC